MSHHARFVIAACAVALSAYFIFPTPFVEWLVSSCGMRALQYMVPAIDLASADAADQNRCLVMWAAEMALSPAYYFLLMKHEAPFRPEIQKRMADTINSSSRWKSLFGLVIGVGLAVYVIVGDLQILDVPGLLNGAVFNTPRGLGESATVIRWLKGEFLGNMAAAIIYPMFVAAVYYLLSCFVLKTMPLYARRALSGETV